MIRKEFIEELNKRGITEETVENAISYCREIALRNKEKYNGEIPWMNTEDGKYSVTELRAWTNGFWPGIMWLIYDACEDETLKEGAQSLFPRFIYQIDNKLNVAHHDIGFLFSLTSVAEYMLTGSEEAKKTAIKAAEHLITMFREKGNYIDAWGNKSNPTAQRNFLIIDSLMNVPLLRKVSRISGDMKYWDIADRHVNTVRNSIFREDGSTYHRALFDDETGNLIKCDTVQGHSENSCWTRGQAWGIYGFAIDYSYTKNEESKKCFKRVADYFIDHLPEDKVCYWDFDFTTGSDEPRDSSASAIAACGMIEMAENLPDGEERDKYLGAAFDMLASLIKNYSVKPEDGVDGFILHGTGSKPHGMGVDECNIWGDYYYMEALTRLIKKWEMYW